MRTHLGGRKALVIAAAAVMIGGAAAGCGNDAGAPVAPPAAPGAGLSFGEMGVPEEADRTIEVVAADDMTFTPQRIELRAGEVVTFVVHNEGKITHELVLGDEQTQEEHEKEMSMHGAMPHEHPFGVSVGPGETRALTWHFTKAGSFLFGCHEPGHYAAGMVGHIEVR